MTSAILPTPSSGAMLLWKDANAVEFYAREVVSEVPVRPSRAIDFARAVGSFCSTTFVLRNRFGRLAVRQERLIGRFEEQDFDSWSPEDCGQMAGLLEELVVDLGALARSAGECPMLMRVFWEDSIETLSQQRQVLQDVAFRLDALSVPEVAMPGDAGYRDFLSRLEAVEDYDCSLDKDRRKAHHLV